MEFHLNYTPPRSLVDITHADKTMLLGSCFAENIGEKLKGNKFNCLINPNGILFNPMSIVTALSSYIHPEKYKLNCGVNNGLHFSFDHHGDFSLSTKEELEKEIKRSLEEAHTFLKEAKFLIITLGSSYVYRRLESAVIVANCHKLPQNNFVKDLLSVQTIVSEYTSMIGTLKEFNPELNVIFTVSPVKYLRDGIINNNLSKSILIQSVHQLTTAHCLLPSAYFPAYELVNDDLRDYRFYKEDMAHPNEQAIDYVWKKFSDTYFNEDTKQLNERINDLTKAASHRPIHENTETHSQFKKAYLQKCQQLEKEFSFLNLTNEKNIFQ